MRQMRTVIRSMLTADGVVVVAMDDAAIVWKPRDGKQKRVRLNAKASVLLGLIGPMGVVDKIVVGDDYGGINFISTIFNGSCG